MDIMNVEEYKTRIGGIARRFKQSQIKAATAVNVEMLKSIGRLVRTLCALRRISRGVPSSCSASVPI